VEAMILGGLYWIGIRSAWTTFEQYREGIQIAGLIVVGVGFFGVKGNWDGTRSCNYQYSMSVSTQSSWKRTQQTLLDFSQAFRFLILMILIGVSNILLGFLF